MPLHKLLREVEDEITTARLKHGSFNSSHEGYAVILEELDELWDHVKANTGYTENARIEAIQIAAMAIKYALMIEERW